MSEKNNDEKTIGDILLSNESKTEDKSESGIISKVKGIFSGLGKSDAEESPETDKISEESKTETDEIKNDESSKDEFSSETLKENEKETSGSEIEAKEDTEECPETEESQKNDTNEEKETESEETIESSVTLEETTDEVLAPESKEVQDKKETECECPESEIQIESQEAKEETAATDSMIELKEEVPCECPDAETNVTESQESEAKEDSKTESQESDSKVESKFESECLESETIAEEIESKEEIEVESKETENELVDNSESKEIETKVEDYSEFKETENKAEDNSESGKTEAKVEDNSESQETESKHDEKVDCELGKDCETEAKVDDSNEPEEKTIGDILLDSEIKESRQEIEDQESCDAPESDKSVESQTTSENTDDKENVIIQESTSENKQEETLTPEVRSLSRSEVAEIEESSDNANIEEQTEKDDAEMKTEIDTRINSLVDSLLEYKEAAPEQEEETSTEPNLLRESYCQKYKITEAAFDLSHQFFNEHQENNLISNSLLSSVVSESIKERIDVSASQNHIVCALNAIDTDNDDKINFDEFIRFLYLFFSSKNNFRQRVFRVLDSQSTTGTLNNEEANDAKKFLDNFYSMKEEARNIFTQILEKLTSGLGKKSDAEKINLDEFSTQVATDLEESLFVKFE